MKSRSWLRPLLWPVSVLYSAIVRVRTWCYRSGIFRTRRLPGTVISVGNLTVGGTGKTPVVLWIGERLAEEGKRAAILTRGYRGKSGKDEQGEPQSDEVALLRSRLAGKVKIGVGADRYKNGQVLARHGTEWFVLDDGFQHLQLARDVNIVLVDATDPVGGRMTLPGGRLREPMSALNRADLLVITRSVQAPAPAIEVMLRRYTKAPVFYAMTNLESVLRVPQLLVEMPGQDWQHIHWAAFCGIGNPSAYFANLRGWGFQVRAERKFGDHHVYTAAEAAKLEQMARNCGAEALICTEKDVWNLRHVQFSMPVFCCRICLESPADFKTAIDAVIAQKREGAA